MDTTQGNPPDAESPRQPDLDAALAELGALLRGAFVSADPYHGVAHALGVEATVVALCAEPDVTLTADERFVVRAAALLHDVGYASYEPSWSQDRREHIAAGLTFAARALPELSLFAHQPEWIDQVLYLIAHHDDTNYAYPSLTLDGRAAPVALGKEGERVVAYHDSVPNAARKRLALLLGLLREADAHAATNTSGARRTFDYSVGRGLPVFASASPLNAWCWEESAIGNTRVAAKRMLIDAVTARGRAQAGNDYAAVEAFVAEVCAQQGVAYVPEAPILDVGKVDHSAFRLTRYRGWSLLEAALREVPVIGDRTLKPYAGATIKARRVAIDELRPMAYYALHDKLDRHGRLQAALERRYAISLFDLTGIIDYDWPDTHTFADAQAGADFRMAPPIVEIYDEPGEGQVKALVDGLHRVLLARERGLDSLWVVEISDIPPTMPLVPLPLTWADVTLADEVPPLHAKRRFRFPTRASFPDLSSLSVVPINDKNFMYFFYRDLSFLGSEGIRSST